MGVLGLPVLLMVVAVAAAAGVYVVRAWQLSRQWSVLAGSLVLAEVAFLAAGAVIANHQVRVFGTWSDLFGARPAGTYREGPPHGLLDPAMRSTAGPGGATVRLATGRRPAIGCDVAHIPRQYINERHDLRQYPIIVVTGTARLDSYQLDDVTAAIVVDACGSHFRASSVSRADRSRLHRSFRSFPSSRGWALIGTGSDAWAQLVLALQRPAGYGVLGLIDPDSSLAAKVLARLPTRGCALQVVVGGATTAIPAEQAVWERLRHAGCGVAVLPTGGTGVLPAVTGLLPAPLAAPYRVRSVRVTIPGKGTR